MKTVVPSLVAAPIVLTALVAVADQDPEVTPAQTLTQSALTGAPAAQQGASDRVAPGTHAVVGVQCSLIDFEGFAESEAIGTVLGSPNVTFGPSWIAVIDSDAPGGTANIANEPSPSTVAVFLLEADPIDFDLGVRYVEIFYSAAADSVPVTLTAWDGPGGTGNVIDTQQGLTIGSSVDGAMCSGDPFGNFCLWDRIILTAPTDSIQSITIDGATTNLFAFDNMLFCTDVPCDAPASNVPLLGSGLNPAGTLVANELPILGSQTYGVTIDDRFDACGLSATGVQTFVVWSQNQMQVPVPGFGCGPGDFGEVFVAEPVSLILGPQPWSPGQGTFFNVALPPDTGLCEFDCFAQGFFFDPAAPGGPYIVTNGIAVVVGI